MTLRAGGGAECVQKGGLSIVENRKGKRGSRKGATNILKETRGHSRGERVN